MAITDLPSPEHQIEALFRAHYSKLVRYAQIILSRNAQCKEPGRAEDAVQETFAIAWAKREALFASPNPAGWLYNTAGNVVRNLIRDDQQWAARLLQAQSQLAHRPFQPPPGADLDLEGFVSQEDLDLLKRLYWEGMTYDELAEELGTTKSTLASRIHRSKERFRAAYQDAEQHPSAHQEPAPSSKRSKKGAKK